MVIVLTGGTGLVGQALRKQLVKRKYTVHLLSRRLQSFQPLFLWPDVESPLPQEAFPEKEDYGVIHLLGEPVSRWPWTRSRKEKIYSSRIHGTQRLVSLLKNLSHPPQFFLSVSAIGIYGDRGGRELTEQSDLSPLRLFLQKVCKDWEEVALSVSSLSRTLIFRLGIVLSSKKGFLYEQNKWLKKGICPLILGSKDHWLSWISIEDLVSMILWAIENKKAEGIYNAVSPKPALLKEFYDTLAQTCSKNITEGQSDQNPSPFFVEKAKKIFPKMIRIPLPLFLMKNLGGEMTRNLLASSKVFPEKALSQGFVFQQDKLEKALLLS